MTRRQATRPAFTLVELLVVIAIIGILMSLLLAAVTKTMTRIEETRTRNDIAQLSQAIESFKAKYNVGYIPSRIVLRRQLSTYGTTPLELDSKAYINQVWPTIDRAGAVSHNWGGMDGATLYGHQCLVFFLGGIQVNGACTGFSTNPNDPTAPGGDRVSFFDFPTNRLVDAGGGFLAFKDGYGKVPYAYFSSYKKTNGYNRYPGSDCSTLSTTFAPLAPSPYAENLGGAAGDKYLNPNTFQIISAGRDKNFGRGTFDAAHLWNARNPTGNADYVATAPGADDMSNFSDRFLGIPVN